MKKKLKSKKTVAITGGSGYIGSCLSTFLSKKYKVIIIDKKNKSFFLGKNKTLHKRYKIVDWQ